MEGHNRRNLLLLTMAVVAALGLCWCDDDAPADGDADGDTDGDTDGDGDSDGDTDGDTDGDSDGDADGDSDGDSDADADEERLPEITIAANDPNLVYMGRFDMSDGSAPRCGWSGCAVTARVDARAVRLRIEDDWGDNWISVIIDDSEAQVIDLASGQAEYELAADLAPGTHEIQVFRRTEAFFGEIALLEWTLEDALPLRPPSPPTRELVFVGDSITCGYGNEGVGPDCSFTAETENAYFTYAALVARHFDAAYSSISWSGIGMYRNNDGNTSDTMPSRFDRTLPLDDSSSWPFDDSPDAVVINLGTNDFAPGVPAQTDFVDAYVAFVEDLRSYYPDAYIFCTNGSMLSDSWPAGAMHLTTIRSYLDDVVDTRRAAGDLRIEQLLLEPQSDADGLGCDWHPGLRTNEIMAETLRGPMGERLGW